MKKGVHFPDISVVIDLYMYFDCSLGYLTGAKQDRGSSSVSKIYDRYVDLYEAILDNYEFSDEFKKSLFMDIKNKFGC